MNNILENFHNNVALKYSLYNSLFLTLPFHKMQEVGTLLGLFAKYSSQEIKLGKDPTLIVDRFFEKNVENDQAQDKVNVLFTMLQFVERQIVLFDALEDAAYATTHQLNGPGTIENLITKIINTNKQEQFFQEIQNYQVRVVLTAHPTQFYPSPVLGIITQLTEAIQKNNLKEISELLWQMGKTSFKYQQKPTPFQEAQSLIWYLENIFYKVIPTIQMQINNALKQFRYQPLNDQSLVELGFWPGGDRDGNPNVTADITLSVAKLLKIKILKLYIEDIDQLRKKLTFKGILENLNRIYLKLLDNQYETSDQLLEDLYQLRKDLITDHSSLFIDRLDAVINKIHCFGFYFAAMDMRENSQILRSTFQHLVNNFENYQQAENDKKKRILEKILNNQCKFHPSASSEPAIERTIASLAAIQPVQKANGQKGLCRFVISNTQSALDVLELLAMLHLAGNFDKKITVDIIPLFESIKDLENSSQIMEQLYRCSFYQDHLKNRNQTQTIMLGFSDGTKDGGYVSANWSIHKAKMALTELSERYQIKVIFFDGRGGPPARGGGNTHHFYRSLGNQIAHRTLQLTIQGQTISSNFGTETSARFNIEQLFTAGIEDLIFKESANDLSETNKQLLQQLSDLSKAAYFGLKQDPLFIPYLEEMTPLKFYSELNIGSRPTSRNKSATLKFDDLRAIPFVGSWNQLKQNIPGYYGFGFALKKLLQKNEPELKNLYQESLFFRTLVENTMMSLCKTFFSLTAYMRKDARFGRFWSQLHNEAKLTQILLEKISGQNCLLENDPLNRESIKLREQIVLPLLVIQQYAMSKMKELQASKQPHLSSAYKEMILKSLAANTNASRNSA
ncbi:MAG: phosphoenolpyruvate carboxylase [Proteobacteria bacterium]|nr:phosphoenolpyruvate carboxylase [Pseudomonadota bacterium]